VDLFFVQGFSFLGFLKNLGFVGYVLLFLHSRYSISGMKGIGIRLQVEQRIYNLCPIQCY